MRSRLVAPALLALTLALAPPVGAHGEHGFEQGRIVGDLYVSLGLEAQLPMANTPTQVVVQVSRVDRPGETGVQDVDLVLFDPQNATTRPDVSFQGMGFVGEATFTEAGTWRANLTLHPQNVSTEFSFPVYEEGPYVWDSPNAATDVFAVGTEAEVQVRVLDWRSGDRAPAPWDVTARVEHWTDDHSRKLNETVVTLEPMAPGYLTMKYAFPAPGMYHVFIASPTLDLEYDDRPYVHAFAVPCEQALEYEPEHACGQKAKATPAPAAALAAVAAGAVALALRRRRA